MSQDMIDASPDMTSSTKQSDERLAFASPGVPRNRKIGTGIFIALVGAFTLLVAADQKANVIISTVIALFFIGGFIFYLRIAAPPPFQIFFDSDAIRREEQGTEQITVPWDQVVKVKEERFPNQLPISIAIYKRVGAKGLHRAFIVYRDDLPAFSQFIDELKNRISADVRWNIEITHE
jgi:hypothetical protein